MQALFQSAQHIYEKREGSGAGSSLTLTNVSGSVGPKTSGSCGSGSPTLPACVESSGPRTTACTPHRLHWDQCYASGFHPEAIRQEEYGYKKKLYLCTLVVILHLLLELRWQQCEYRHMGCSATSQRDSEFLGDRTPHQRDSAFFGPKRCNLLFEN